MVWTYFHDMHSGGRQKLEWSRIAIEAPEAEAKSVFYARFKRNPERVTCTCCGSDYSISEEPSLEAATAYDRNCEFSYFRPDGSECSRDEGWTSGKGTTPGYSSGYVERQRESNMAIRRKCSTPERDKWGLYIPLGEYLKSGAIKVVPAAEITAAERKQSVPEEGYVWADS